MNTKKAPQSDKRAIDKMRDIRDRLNVKLSAMTTEQRRIYFDQEKTKSVSKP